jgi:hypothetical protein
MVVPGCAALYPSSNFGRALSGGTSLSDEHELSAIFVSLLGATGLNELRDDTEEANGETRSPALAKEVAPADGGHGGNCFFH